jgi:hypothetical protein
MWIDSEAISLFRDPASLVSATKLHYCVTLIIVVAVLNNKVSYIIPVMVARLQIYLVTQDSYPTVAGWLCVRLGLVSGNSLQFSNPLTVPKRDERFGVQHSSILRHITYGFPYPRDATSSLRRMTSVLVT